jgi:uncharacterized protein YndB with AHSA1/START domain
MRISASILCMAPMLAVAPATAAVLSAGDHGFEVQHSVNLVVPPAEAYAAFAQIGGWWDNQHSYSGDAKRLTLNLRPGGCFCETLDDGGGVEHMRVAYVQPGERVVLTGSLGPMLYEATSGVMDVRFERIAGGTKVSLSYRVAGFAKGGAAAMAPVVDQVLGTQMKRYRSFSAAGGEKPKL